MHSTIQPRYLIVGLVAGVLLSFAALILLASVSPATWDIMQPATCLINGNCFCEAIQQGEALRQPHNTLSSFGFVLVGAIIAAASLGLTGRLIPLYGAALGVMTVIIGLGSAYYHASLTFTGQFFDILGMFLTASFVLIYALQRGQGWSNGRAVGIYLALNLILALLQWFIPDLRRYTFAVVLLIGLAFEFRYLQGNKPNIAAHWLYQGLAIFGLAYVIWILDNSRIVCAPTSTLQGHAVWHLFGAVATVCLFRYYASETRTED